MNLPFRPKRETALDELECFFQRDFRRRRQQQMEVIRHNHKLMQQKPLLATILHKNSIYQTLPVSTLAKQIQSDKIYIAPYAGYISQADWERGLQVLNSYGLQGFDPNDPIYAYDKRVDMSYYTQALGQPPSGS